MKGAVENTGEGRVGESTGCGKTRVGITHSFSSFLSFVSSV